MCSKSVRYWPYICEIFWLLHFIFLTLNIQSKYFVWCLLNPCILLHLVNSIILHFSFANLRCQLYTCIDVISVILQWYMSSPFLLGVTHIFMLSLLTGCFTDVYIFCLPIIFINTFNENISHFHNCFLTVCSKELFCSMCRLHNLTTLTVQCVDEWRLNQIHTCMSCLLQRSVWVWDQLCVWLSQVPVARATQLWGPPWQQLPQGITWSRLRRPRLLLSVTRLTWARRYMVTSNSLYLW